MLALPPSETAARHFDETTLNCPHMVKEVSADIERGGYPLALTKPGDLDIKVYEGKEYLGLLSLPRAGIVWREGDRPPRSIAYRDLERAAEVL